MCWVTTPNGGGQQLLDSRAYPPLHLPGNPPATHAEFPGRRGGGSRATPPTNTIQLLLCNNWDVLVDFVPRSSLGVDKATFGHILVVRLVLPVYSPYIVSRLSSLWGERNLFLCCVSEPAATPLGMHAAP